MFSLKSRAVAGVVLLLCVIASAKTLLAQTPPAAAQPSLVRFGVFGGVSFNQHLTNFTEFSLYVAEPSPLQQPFSTATIPQSYSLGAFAEFSLIDKFGVALRGSVTNVGGFVLTGTERLLFPIGIAVVSVVEITHKMTINDMALIGAEPYLTLRVLDVITLYAGARFGFPVNPTFAYAQTVPEDGQYRFLISPPGQSSTRYDVRNGAIPQANTVQTALSGGISFEIPLDAEKHWFVAAEGFYMYGLTQVANGLLLRRPLPTFNGLSATRVVPQNELGTDRDPFGQGWPSEIVPGSWLMNNIRAGLSLRFAP
ncbi:MAG: hypothetical protein MUF71_06145 [Candidatus Kapabacteria bacterium]|nr:hypothetical protein [Candidatus Kapabacteria bacterium]